MNRFHFSVSGGLLAALAALALAAPRGRADDPAPHVATEQAAFFESKIRPVLANSCFSCHGEQQRGGLRLDSRTSALKGGLKGVVIVPGDADKSRIIAAIRYDGPLRMPPAGKL